MMAKGKANKTGRSSKMGAFTPMLHSVLDSPAFQSLTPLAQCLYWRLRRFAGYDGARNGEAFLSVRDAADEFGVHKDTIRKAFDLLQARGFTVATQLGSLGVDGEGKATLWRLTELPTKNDHSPSKDFLAWKPGHDFPVLKGRPPRHARKPVLRNRTPCPTEPDIASVAAPRQRPPCPTEPDDGAVIEAPPVLGNGTYKDLPGRREAA